MRKNLITSLLFMLATGFVLGILYPLLMTGLAQLFMPDKANGQLVQRLGVVIGSRIIGQPFNGAGYFHERPSAAGAYGYDATSSGGSNFGPMNRKYVDRVGIAVAALQKENPGVRVPIDLVTASASGLDPDITPAAAYFQIQRIAQTRGISEKQVRNLIAKHTESRQFGFLGEPRVNVLEVNLALDGLAPSRAK